MDTTFLTQLQFSWSAFELYEGCPFKFYQSYGLKNKGPSNIFALYGCAIHRLLDHIYSVEKFNSKYSYAIWDKTIQVEYESKIKQYKDITQDQVDKIKPLGYKHIKNFFELAITENLLKPAIFTEEEIKGNYRNHKLTTKLDCGTYTKYGVTLLDWKTGEKSKKDFYQLIFYIPLCQKKIGKKIDMIAPVYLKTKTIAYQEITPALKKEVSEYISDIYNRIMKDKEFLPKKTNKYCSTCYLKQTKVCPN